jgi:dephospho-CoA kinase
MWIVVTGRLASGKTTVAHAVAPVLGADVVTVSTVMKELSEALGVPSPDRRQLQDLGADLIKGGPRALGELLVAAVGDREVVIVDGLRIVDVALWLRQQFPPGSLRVVYFEARPEVRRARYDGRGVGSDFEQADDHPVERGAEKLRSIADRIVDAEQPLDTVQSELIRLISEWRDEEDSGAGVNN